MALAPHTTERAFAEHRFCGEDQLISGGFLASSGELKFAIWSMTYRQPFSNPELEYVIDRRYAVASRIETLVAKRNLASEVFFYWPNSDRL